MYPEKSIHPCFFETRWRMLYFSIFIMVSQISYFEYGNVRMVVGGRGRGWGRKEPYQQIYRSLYLQQIHFYQFVFSNYEVCT